MFYESRVVDTDLASPVLSTPRVVDTDLVSPVSSTPRVVDTDLVSQVYSTRRVVDTDLVSPVFSTPRVVDTDLLSHVFYTFFITDFVIQVLRVSCNLCVPPESYRYPFLLSVLNIPSCFRCILNDWRYIGSETMQTVYTEQLVLQRL